MTPVIAYLSRAVGAPGPTLVMDRAALPAGEEALLAALADIRRRLPEVSGAEVLKLALIGPARHPLYDLDYRFVQAMPGAPDRFDLRGNCGHSILAAITAAERMGLLPRLAPGQRVRVNALNNGDRVVCEVDQAGRRGSVFTAHFLAEPGTRLGSLLMTGKPVSEGAAAVASSYVRMGNPYIFVDAADLGVRHQDGLFRDDRKLFAALTRLREDAAVRLGWAPEGAFPKIAAVASFRPGRLAVRALTVPGWHPGLALTGVVCLAAATAIGGTVPNRLLGPDRAAAGRIAVDTPGGPVTAACATTGDSTDDELMWISVGEKESNPVGPVNLGPLTVTPMPEEAAPCLSLSA
ncbi:PrpF domain-containing protein [Actinacidiphila oryziradicis]|uniref:3-methylitaconate isomerase n=1 Tax=Actinacidiphila oryziradicis TaxID=2571141 RepID=A0A4U0SNP7_9ACTN|nr:PrpF domain-containing protein [Actinacidiphila oryziradicis]TKA10828.1 hypothetical protein FCI23_14460 [Actinacidiphila oryziradicis]